MKYSLIYMWLLGVEFLKLTRTILCVDFRIACVFYCFTHSINSFLLRIQISNKKSNHITILKCRRRLKFSRSWLVVDWTHQFVGWGWAAQSKMNANDWEIIKQIKNRTRKSLLLSALWRGRPHHHQHHHDHDFSPHLLHIN